MPIAQLERTVLRLSGTGVTEWLDGLITNSLKTEINFAALLTPQGKIIADFFVARDQDNWLIDTPQKFAAALHKRLRLYKLRAPITIEICDDLNVYAMWDGEGDEGYADPRLPALGTRLITADVLQDTGDYNAHRLSLGIPDSQWDFDTEQVFPADANMDLVHGVDYKKGCFIGQEVVSRMKRMTTVRKRLRGVVLDGPAQAGDSILCDTRVIGTVFSVHENMAMALIRLDRLMAATSDPKLNEHSVQIMSGPDGEH